MQFAFFSQSEITKLGNFNMPETAKVYLVGSCKRYDGKTVLDVAEKKTQGVLLSNIKREIKFRNKYLGRTTANNELISTKDLAERLSVSKTHVGGIFLDAREGKLYSWSKVLVILESLVRVASMTRSETREERLESVISTTDVVSCAIRTFEPFLDDLFNLKTPKDFGSLVHAGYALFRMKEAQNKKKVLEVNESFIKVPESDTQIPLVELGTKLIFRNGRGMWDHLKVAQCIVGYGMQGNKYHEIQKKLSIHDPRINNTVIARALKLTPNVDVSTEESFS